MRSLRHLTVALCAWFFVTNTAQATTMIALDLQQLVGHSNEIVVGKVLTKKSRWTENGKIVTEITIQVSESYKGSCQPGELVYIYQLGGSVDGVGMKIAGSTNFLVSEEYLLLQKARPDAADLESSCVL